MTEKKCLLTEKLRTYVFRYGTDLSDENLRKVNITREEIDENFSDMEDIVNSIFERERICFEEIFDKYNFEGWNAIDILLLVGNEINDRFFNVSPSVTFKLAKAYPEIYEKHRLRRSDFIFEKIKINIEKGMQQGMYKNDVSSEMVARMYIAKLNDIHNPEIYPPEGYDFATIFNNMIDSVIKTITNEEGWQYYKQRKQLYNVLNFNR
ncbi:MULTISPECIES: hypothetical protein [Porphyromonadaceae]|uniref:TetR/AcrR family transcriptional regulator n=1 Tax=Sanguibacteroides justesenii TaxID=1547597 RepID=A0A0C3RFC4_9PORP|nr:MULTISPECIES: hypothetical protein [Porphyromonadaceae]KIO43909.1 hypothetical protein BA92_10950 [Sanguibacteroides justesenii]KIO46520.1 hypothetical protein IE90_04010 [Sanguibacteroides justesenii]PXZ44013.1 hypothetical protein DMB45_08565 [Sanguibacteroides justesenii]